VPEIIPPVVRVTAPTWRIVPSRFPPVSLFDDVAPGEDLALVFAIEALTNPRLRDEVGDIMLVPAEDRVSGPGTTPVMAAFTHLNPDGGRFTTAHFGAWYGGLDLQTAVEETKHGREKFLRLTGQPEIDVDMRVYVADIDAEVHDVRGRGGDHPGLYDPDSHSAGQGLATRLRESGSDGVIYDSVRNPGGECVAVYRPRLISGCRQERHLTYRWDGQRITEVYEKRAFSA
jgi:RES domain-containing protein